MAVLPAGIDLRLTLPGLICQPSGTTGVTVTSPVFASDAALTLTVILDGEAGFTVLESTVADMPMWPVSVNSALSLTRSAGN